MNDDKYPLVVNDGPLDGWGTSIHGTHKVVPADAIVIENHAGFEASPRGRENAERIVRERLGADVLDRPRMMIARLADLAVAVEYLRTHPPVDEAEVQRLTKVLCDVEMDHPDGPVPHVIARRLYLAGVRAPEVIW